MELQKNDAVWKPLIKAAKSRLKHLYTGVCIDTSSLGMCVERNAGANMITCGESRIPHSVCIMGNDTVGSPCGTCREF